MLAKAPHREDIKAAIRKKGSTLADISRKAGLNERTGANSLFRPIPRINRAIADFLGVTLHDLWPRWYDQNGERIKSQAPPKPTRKTSSRHRQKSSL